MPAALPIAAQVGAAAIVKAAGLGAIAGSFIVAGSGIVGSYLASRLLRGGSSQLDALINVKLNTATTQRTIPLVYGEQRVGSNDVFMEMKGRKPKYMYIVHCLGEGEVEGISQDKGKNLIYVNDKLVSEYKPGLIEYWFHNGSNTQAVDSTLLSVFGGAFNDPMINTSYIVFKIKYDNSIFSGIPTRQVVLKGIKVYDFRTTLTEWTQNPVLILYDVLTNSRYGSGMDPAIFDTTGSGSSWWSAANYCDLSDPSSLKSRFYIDLIIGNQSTSQSIIDTILSHFRGTLSWFGGKIYLHYSDLRYEAPVFDITDNDIARDDSGRDLVSVMQPSSHSVPDGLVIKFLNKRNGWTIDDFPIGESNGNIKQIQFVGLSSRQLAEELGYYILERERLGRVYSLSLRPNTIELDINDVGTLNSTELGLKEQLVRVRESSISPDGTVAISFILEHYYLYDTTYQCDLSEVFDINLPSVLSQPPQIENIQFVESVYQSKGDAYTRLTVTFDPPINYPWFSHVEVYYKTEFDGTWTILFNSADDFTIESVQERTTYYFKMNSVSSYGIRQDDDLAAFVQHTIIGTSDIRPTPPLYLDAVVSFYDVSFYSPDVSCCNIDKWEYRRSHDLNTTITGLSDGWGDSIFITCQAHPFINMIKFIPGKYKIWVDTWKNSSTQDGLYSGSPKSTIIEIDAVSGEARTVIKTEVLDLSTGTYDNAEYVTGSPGYLKCSRVSGLLYGTFISQEYDCSGTPPIPAGSSYQIILDKLIFNVLGNSSTWDDVAPTSPVTTWSSLQSGASWGDITNTSGRAPKLKISVLSSSVSGGPYTEYPRLETQFVSASHKYVKFKFYLEDYSYSTNLVVYDVCSYISYTI